MLNEEILENPLYFKKMLNRKARLYISSGGDAPVPDAGAQVGKHSLFAAKFYTSLEENNSSIILVRKFLLKLKNMYRKMQA